jgi:hypothetical protein
MSESARSKIVYLHSRKQNSPRARSARFAALLLGSEKAGKADGDSLVQTVLVTLLCMTITLVVGAVIYATAFGAILPAIQFWEGISRDAMITATDQAALTARVDGVDWSRCGIRSDAAKSVLIVLPATGHLLMRKVDAEHAEKAISYCETLIAVNRVQGHVPMASLELGPE